MSRTCGDCTACCTVLAVHELDKPVNTVCKYDAGGSCAIYSERPQSCRDYECLWLVSEEWMRLAERPDRVGVILDLGNTDRTMLTARQVRPGAFSETTAKKMLNRLAGRAVIYLLDDDRRRIMGPSELVRTKLRVLR